MDPRKRAALLRQEAQGRALVAWIYQQGPFRTRDDECITASALLEHALGLFLAAGVEREALLSAIDEAARAVQQSLAENAPLPSVLLLPSPPKEKAS